LVEEILDRKEFSIRHYQNSALLRLRA
jgi:hypothetical protein